MNDFKGCPFCGDTEPAVVADKLYGKKVYFIICGDCALTSRYFDTEQEAIDWWNNREKSIDSIPTVDVREVVHGKWIKTTIAEPCGTDELHMPIYRGRETVKCSECGNPSPIYNIEFEFCPRCGAKMDSKR